MIECRWCAKIFSSNESLSGHLNRCNSWKTWRDASLTKVILEELYVNRQMSMPEIAQYFELKSCSTIYRKLKEFGFERKISDAKKLPRAKARAEATNLARHGAKHNFSKTHPSRICWEKELFENEGITNVFQRPDVIKRIQENPNWQNRLIENQCVSKLELSMSSSLARLGFLHSLAHKIRIGIFTPDFLNVETKTIIEIFGDFWHANPAHDVYGNPNWQNPFSKQTSQQIWERDAERQKFIESQGFTVVTLWETQIKQGTWFISGSNCGSK